MRARKKGIEIYRVGKVLGLCDAHPAFDKWCVPNVPFVQRWKLLHRPNEMPPHELFHYEKSIMVLLWPAFITQPYTHMSVPKVVDNEKLTDKFNLI